ncbi:quinone oxidoreductase [Penicillium macrosclerotiorum]|uniref:quinone oxidoreductase n=1 Tax=Penicillium macrosclerotiorum TaxID=303699 RepID=UPI0025491A9F|nr:quinone oxidoreductase [Penicillium macrosclerotiorum]KAJ5698279.1 quinone oxidoreductase [Penicillium macrosclerotiorum]
MKEVIVQPTLPQVTAYVRDTTIPNIAPDEMLVKVEVAASNPKSMYSFGSQLRICSLTSLDFKHLYATNKAVNSGDDVAGYVSAVAKDVENTGEFCIGDRVAGFHKMLMPGGAYDNVVKLRLQFF